MKIQILSDLHIEFNAFEFPESAADVVVLAGDTHNGTDGIRWALEAIPDRPVIYINGNHEFYGHAFPKLLDEQRQLAHNTNVHLLENESIIIQGVRFLGCTLWSDYKLVSNPKHAMEIAQTRINDYRLINLSDSGTLFKPHNAMISFAKSKKWLAESLNTPDAPNIVVTHFAPHIQSIPIKYRHDPLCAAFASDLTQFIRKFDIKLWIHGHLHDHTEYVLEKTQVVCNPRGYPVEYPRTGFIQDRIVEL